MPLSFPSAFWGGTDLMPPVTDYVLWLDFGDPNAIFLPNGQHPNGSTPVGTYIAQVKDKSPLGNNAIAVPQGGTKGFQYMQPAAGYNGRSVAKAMGTGVLTGTWKNYDKLTVYLIYQQTSTTTDKARIFSQQAYSAGDKTYIPLVYSSSIAVFSLSSSGGAAAGVTMSPNVWKRLIHRKTADNATNQVAAMLSSSSVIAVGDVLPTAKVDYLVGGQLALDAITTSMMTQGLYAEIIAFPRALTPQEEIAMDDYFKAKWGPPVVSLGAAAERALTAAELAAIPNP